MCVRVIINVTQCYIPMYTLETLDLSKVGSSLFGYHKQLGSYGRPLKQPLMVNFLLLAPLCLGQ